MDCGNSRRKFKAIMGVFVNNGPTNFWTKFMESFIMIKGRMNCSVPN